MSNDNNDNVVAIGTQEPVDTDKKAEELERLKTCELLLDRTKDLGPINLIVIGLTKEGVPFISDSEQSSANVSFMTDLAKQMLMSNTLSQQ